MDGYCAEADIITFLFAGIIEAGRLCVLERIFYVYPLGFSCLPFVILKICNIYLDRLAVFIPSSVVAKLSLRSEVPPWYLLAPAFPSKILGYINGGLHSEGKWLRLLFLTLELKVDTKSLSIIMGPYVTIYNTWASARVSSISLFLWHFILFMFRKEWERAFRELSYLLILWKKLE